MDADRGAKADRVEPEPSRVLPPLLTADALRRMSAVVLEVSEAASLAGALAALGRGAISLLGGAAGAIRAYNVDQQGKNVAYWVRADGTLEEAEAADPPPESVAGRLRAGEPGRIIDDLWALNPASSPLYAALRARGLRASVAVPIVSGGERIGSLHVDHPEVAHFGEEHLALAEALATVAGSAVERARSTALREQEGRLRRLYAEAQDAADSHVQLNAALRAAAEERDQALAELARLYESERAARQELEVVLATVADGVTVQDASGRVTYANDAAARLAGYDSAAAFLEALTAPAATRPPAAYAGSMLDEHGAQISLDQLPGRRALRGEPAPELVVRYSLPGGASERWSVVRSRPVLDSAGTPRLAVNVIHDLTERKRAEGQQRFLADATGLLSSSLDVHETLQHIAALTVPAFGDWCTVSLLADDGTLQRVAAVHVDPEKMALLEELNRVAPPSPRQTSFLAHTLDSGRGQLDADVTDDALARASQNEAHLAVLRALGTRSVLLVPLVARGETLGALTLVMADSGRRHDASDLALAEELARRCALAVQNARFFAAQDQARRDASQALRARDEFLTMAAHELKTPVTVALAYAQLEQRHLKRRGAPDPERVLRALRTIEAQARRLDRLVADLFDVTRLEHGRLSLSLSRVDLVALVRRAVETQQVLAGSHARVSLTIDGETVAGEGSDRTGTVRDGSPALECDVDPVRLEQVLTNLIRNAVAFGGSGRHERGNTPTSRVDVTVSASAESLQITVRDYGPGVAHAHRERIFERFFQVAATSARDNGGANGTAVTAVTARDGNDAADDWDAGDGDASAVATPTPPAAGLPGMGLGLYVSQQIVEAHGGTLRAEYPDARDGGGARFIASLPRWARHTAADPHGDTADKSDDGGDGGDGVARYGTANR